MLDAAWGKTYACDRLGSVEARKKEVEFTNRNVCSEMPSRRPCLSEEESCVESHRKVCGLISRTNKAAESPDFVTHLFTALTAFTIALPGH